MGDSIKRDQEHVNRVMEQLRSGDLASIGRVGTPEPSGTAATPAKPADSKVVSKSVLAKFEMTYADLEADMLNLKKLTQSPTLDSALEMAWHKIDVRDKAGLTKHSGLVTLCRLWQDGNLEPPVDLNMLYLYIDQGLGIQEILELKTRRGPRPGRR